jgi:hypothetical protein
MNQKRVLIWWRMDPMVINVLQYMEKSIQELQKVM